MVVQEHFFIGEQEFIRSYSDANVLIHGGVPESDYEEANDPAEFNRQYTETDIPIEPGEAEAEEILDILMGVEE